MNKEKYPEKMREHMNIEVMRMLGCGDISLGFVAYICLKYLEVFKIGFTCKKCGYFFVATTKNKCFSK
ncbi:transposase zinc-binding domain-containing protein [Clostridium estertheticum]|uniref:transposase zinc-binding domain-containing protein n=1 Tax=Clostridium estertheticum TaxID=238834 RepID=UPI001C0E7ADA|nr:transposase zinc-binding domain-containing protein [Clostridium estertheticum]